MIRRCILTLLVVVFGVVGCSGTSQQVQKPIEQAPYGTPKSFPATIGGTAVNTSPPTITQTPTPSITETSIPPSITPTPSFTPISPSRMRFRTQCLDEAPELTSAFRGVGNIFLWKKQGSDHSYVLDMTTGVKSPLPSEWRYWEWLVSPNEKWLTFNSDMDPGIVEIMSFQGEIQKTLYWQRGWLQGGWADDEHLRIFQREIDPTKEIYSLTIYNPFTNDLKKLPVDYPDLYTLEAPFFPLQYDSTLTRLVYPYSVKEEEGFRLRDIQTGKTLAFVPSFALWSSAPVWSPDGRQVLVTGVAGFPDVNAGSVELFSISYDGEVKQLTDFGTYGANISVNSSSWSPDGKFIAFWMWRDQIGVEHLAVLNVDTQEVVDYCIPGMDAPLSDPPIWSPDSQQLIVHDPRQDNPVILVDISQNKAAVVGTNLEPHFWLKTVPEVWVTFYFR